MVTSPTTQPTTNGVTADMVAALTAIHPESAERIQRGVALVGQVERTRTPGLFLVRSAQYPSLAYQVDACGCSCPDRQARTVFCKHDAARALFIAAERAEAEASDPTIAIAVESADESVPYGLTYEAYLVLEELQQPACPRCGDPGLARHVDHLCVACIRREVFGDDAA